MKLNIICPVKNSTQTALHSIQKVMESNIDFEFEFTVYNDFSDEACTEALGKASKKWGFRLVNLSEITNHPSPNYRLILQSAQEKSLKEGTDLLIVESDVSVNPDTIVKMVERTQIVNQPGLLAAVTVDEMGGINYPYDYAVKLKKGTVEAPKHLSFCCTIIRNEFLKAYDFSQLDPEKNWYDVHISHQSLKLGFNNYLCTDLPVLHQPHSSRPWKQLKYKNPLLYYWRKITQKMDKI